MHNENVIGVLMFLDNLTDNDIVTVEETNSNERFNGQVIDVYQWIVDKNKEYNNKGNFQIVF